jgi:hypothetical protein
VHGAGFIDLSQRPALLRRTDGRGVGLEADFFVTLYNMFDKRKNQMAAAGFSKEGMEEAEQTNEFVKVCCDFRCVRGRCV